MQLPVVHGMRFALSLSLPRQGLAGANGGGTLIVHAPQTAYTTDVTNYCGQSALASCDSATVRVPATSGSTTVFYAVAAFPDSTNPSLLGVSFGVQYDPTKLSIVAYGPCGSFELPDAGWPSSGTGNAVTWSEPQTSRLIEAYWFAGYLYLENPPDSTVFRLTAHPDSTLGGTFGDDHVPPLLDPITDFGALGFGTAGYLPCPAGGGLDGDGPIGGDDSEGEGGGVDSPASEYTFIQMNTSTDSAFASTYRELRDEYGMRVLVGLAPDGLICLADDSQRAALAGDSRVSLVTNEAIATVGEAELGQPGHAARVWNEMLVPPEPDTSAAEWVPVEPDSLLEDRESPDPLMQTTTYMMGVVGVSLLFMESDENSSNSETWQDSEILHGESEAGLAVAQLAALQPGSDLTFLFYDQGLVPTTVEPIEGNYGDPQWRNDAMDYFNVPSDPEYSQRLANFATMRRATSFHDGWYTIFMIRDVNDGDRQFADSVGSTPGVASVNILYINRGLESNLHAVVGHESCHVFGAMDEYKEYGDCTTLYGYLKDINGNGPDQNGGTCDPPRVPCIMDHAEDIDDRQVCTYTAHQIGWWDRDEDGVLDPIDHPDADSTMQIGWNDQLAPGDRIDIYGRFTVNGIHFDNFVKGLTLSNWSSDQNRIVWDGRDYNGGHVGYQEYGWKVNSDLTWHSASLTRDTQAPSIQDLEITPDPPKQDILSFRFTDSDSRGARVRATVQPDNVPTVPARIIMDKFFVERGESDPAITQSFQVGPNPGGTWTLTLQVWDAARNTATTTIEHFWPISGVGGKTPHQPELAVSRGRPNPAGTDVSWAIQQKTGGKARLRVVRVDGRCIRSWPEQILPAGTTTLLWDARDNRGMPVPSGRYFLVVTDARGNTRSASTTIIR